MANTFNTVKNAPGVIMKVAAQILEDRLAFCSSIENTGEKDFKGLNGYKAGDTIFISKPPRFTATEDNLDITSTIQDVTDEKVPLVLDISSTVAVDMDSLEMATETDISNIIKTVIEPAVNTIAHNIEKRFLELATDATFNSVGTAGSEAFDVATILASRAKLNKNLAPVDRDRCLILDSDAGALAVTDRKGLFQSASEIGKQYQDGLIGRSDGFDWIESQMVNVHTNGNDVTGLTVASTVSTEGQTTLDISGLTITTGTVTKGTVFTVAGVFAVHPETKVAYSNLQQFVVTADATADGSGDATISVSPTMYTTGGRQNIGSFPQSSDVIVAVGSASTAYSQTLAFHKKAFKMASVPLYLPTNAEFSAMGTSKNGLRLAIIRDFDVNTRKLITRIDFLGGVVAVRPEHACRITA